MYLCTYFVPKLPYGGNALIVTLLKISKVSKSIFYYILINFVKYRLDVIIFCKLKYSRSHDNVLPKVREGPFMFKETP